MDKDLFVNRMSELLKPVRAEYSLTQEEMAETLGISKKTLVETEKGRRQLGWTESVAMALLFEQSSILQSAFGGESSDIVRAIAFAERNIIYPQTMGGKIWWNTIADEEGYKIQQNMISKHYRLLNRQDQRLASSFDRDEIEECLKLQLRKEQ